MVLATTINAAPITANNAPAPKARRPEPRASSLSSHSRPYSTSCTPRIWPSSAASSRREDPGSAARGRISSEGGNGFCVSPSSAPPSSPRSERSRFSAAFPSTYWTSRSPLPRICCESARASASVVAGSRYSVMLGSAPQEVSNQRAGDGDPLLLSAGEPPGKAHGLVREADLIEALAGALADVRIGSAQHLERVSHVLDHGAVVEQLEVLEDDADVAPEIGNSCLAETAEVLSADQDLPAGGLLRAEEQAQQGALVENGRIAGVDLLDVKELDHGHVPASQILIVQGAPLLLQVSVPGNEDDVHGMLPQ